MKIDNKNVLVITHLLVGYVHLRSVTLRQLYNTYYILWINNLYFVAEIGKIHTVIVRSINTYSGESIEVKLNSVHTDLQIACFQSTRVSI